MWIVENMHSSFSVWLVLALSVLSVRAEEFTCTGTVTTASVEAAWQEGSLVAPTGERVRVASYNLENFNDAQGDGPDRTVELRDAQARAAAALLGRIAPDIAVLMEVENSESLQVLNRALAQPFPVAYLTSFGDPKYGPDKLNLACLSRLAVESVTELDFGTLVGPGRPARGSLRVIIPLEPGHKLALYAVHLKSNYGFRPRNIAKRKYALEAVARDAQALAEAHPEVQWEMLVAGDTNVDPEVPEFAGDPSLSPLKEWKDLWLGRSQPERATLPTRYGIPDREFPPVCFDRIFASTGLQAAPWVVGDPGVLQEGVSANAQSIPGVDGHVSDHFPIWVDLTR